MRTAADTLGRSILALAVAVGVASAAHGSGAALPLGAAAQTTTTAYTYNADGALTAVTTQVGGEPATTTYVTWDNFTPNTSDPTTGSVAPANGNMVGYGASPGTAGLEAEFAFDVRDRLIGYANAAGQSTSYAYYPTSILASSTLASGDALRFYYDTSPNPQVTNVVQSSTGITSSFLAGREARYLPDGTAQQLLSPRKDVSGLYDATNSSFASYAFDPYGAPLAAAGGSGGGLSCGSDYDMQQNPFQYTQEYRDPLWGGYYLRARWYDPALQVFLSRDPLANLNRYGYADGNPIMHVDPSGMGYQHTMRPLNNFLNKDLGGEGHGPWGEVWGGAARLLLGPAIGALQLIATPERFWRTLTHSTRQAPFLWAGMVAEVVTAPMPEFSFGPHLILDATFGIGQSTLSAFSHNLRRFRVASFFHGLEFTASSMFYGRYALGLGYKGDLPLTPGDVEAQIGNAEVGKLSLFRFHDDSWPVPRGAWPREGLLAVGDIVSPQNDLYRVYGVTFVDRGLMRQGLFTESVGVEEFLGSHSGQLFGGTTPRTFEYLGEIDQRTFQREFFNNPLRLPRIVPQGQLQIDVPLKDPLGVRTLRGLLGWSANNSANYVRLVLENLTR